MDARLKLGQTGTGFMFVEKRMINKEKLFWELFKAPVEGDVDEDNGHSRSYEFPFESFMLSRILSSFLSISLFRSFNSPIPVNMLASMKTQNQSAIGIPA